MLLVSGRVVTSTDGKLTGIGYVENGTYQGCAFIYIYIAYIYISIYIHFFIPKPILLSMFQTGETSQGNSSPNC